MATLEKLVAAGTAVGHAITCQKRMAHETHLWRKKMCVEGYE